FPTEQDNEIGKAIHRTIEMHGGRERGSVTGRPRRCGWLDGVVLRHTAELNGVTGLAVGMLDVLSAFETLKVCTAYKLDGRGLHSFPASLTAVERVEPVYEELEGWCCDVSDVTRWEELPPQARRYLAAVEELAGAPVEFVSVGPERKQVIEREPDG
ncbi:MAG: adenylosuccinate synthetase, partial [Candidatus Brocadiae bacterium]|nr:adenylosuccinate synthetase [Candidatus Brocadiia bacterium]